MLSKAAKMIPGWVHERLSCLIFDSYSGLTSMIMNSAAYGWGRTERAVTTGEVCLDFMLA
jgi:hypothetical protein